MYQFILAVLTVILGIYLLNDYERFSDFFNLPPVEFDSPASDGERLFSPKELKRFDGIQTDSIYLCILGKVYDVTEGSRHYGPDSNYHIFVGKDSSRAFITGEFSKDSENLDDVLSLSANDLMGLENWMQMYDKQYTYKGKLVGRFYDNLGKETAYLKLVLEKIQQGKEEKLAKENDNKKYPPCNAEWDAATGSRVWCSNKSGGIDRDWEGVPRLMHRAGSTETPCVCVNPEDQASISNPNLKQYDNCDPASVSCQVPNTAD